MELCEADPLLCAEAWRAISLNGKAEGEVVSIE